jgi:hypothetical protein
MRKNASRKTAPADPGLEQSVLGGRGGRLRRVRNGSRPVSGKAALLVTMHQQ